MTITIGGIIYIVILIVIFLKNRFSLSRMYRAFFELAVLTEFLLNAGYVAKLGNFTIAYNYLSSFALFIPSLVICIEYRKKIPSRMPIISLLFLIELFIGVSFSTLTRTSYQGVPFNDNYDSYFVYGKNLPFVSVDLNQFVNMFVRFVIIITNISAFSAIYSRKDFAITANHFYKVGRFVLFIALIEFFFDNFVSDSLIRSLLFSIIGESGYFLPRQFLNFYSPLLASYEPSETSFVYYFFALVALFQLKTANTKSNEKIIIYFMLYLLLLVTTGALTSLLLLSSLLLVIIVYLINDRSYFAGACIIVGSILAFLVIITFFSNRINNIFYYAAKFNYGVASLPPVSEIIRIYSIYNVLMHFFNHPLFGIGLGICFSFGALPTLLCNIGLVGFLLWISLMKASLSKFSFSRASYLVSFFNFFFILFFFGYHMGEMVFYERSFFILVMLTYLSCKEKRLPIQSRANLNKNAMKA